MRFRILGPLEVLSPDGWTAISAPKWRSLLACLLVRPGQLVPTEYLIFELWGDAPPSTANNLVSIYVHQLKKVIGDTDRRILVYRAPGYMLRVAQGDLDIEQFESLAAEGRGSLAAGDPERAAVRLGEALGLWRGPLLADVVPSPLIERHTQRIAELWFTTTELRVEAELACGRAAQVIPELRGLVTEHPLRERLWALLMRALEEAGRRAEALETYSRAREVIADELGVDPGGELQRLYAELLASDASPVAPRPAVPQRLPRISREATQDDRASDDSAGARATVGAGAAPDSIAEAPAAPEAAAAVPDVAADGAPSGEISGTIAIGTFADALAAQVGQQADTAVPPPAPLRVRPAQLPADIGDFTGRETHVAHLCNLLARGRDWQSRCGPHRGGERSGRPGQDHAGRARRASGKRRVPRRAALRGPARGERTVGGAW